MERKNVKRDPKFLSKEEYLRKSLNVCVNAKATLKNMQENMVDTTLSKKIFKNAFFELDSEIDFILKQLSLLLFEREELEKCKKIQLDQGNKCLKIN